MVLERRSFGARAGGTVGHVAACPGWGDGGLKWPEESLRLFQGLFRDARFCRFFLSVSSTVLHVIVRLICCNCVPSHFKVYPPLQAQIDISKVLWRVHAWCFGPCSLLQLSGKTKDVLFGQCNSCLAPDTADSLEFNIATSLNESFNGLPVLSKENAPPSSLFACKHYIALRLLVCSGCNIWTTSLLGELLGLSCLMPCHFGDFCVVPQDLVGSKWTVEMAGLGLRMSHSPFVLNSTSIEFLFLVVWPGAPKSVLAPSSKARSH